MAEQLPRRRGWGSRRGRAAPPASPAAPRPAAAGCASTGPSVWLTSSEVTSGLPPSSTSGSRSVTDTTCWAAAGQRVGGSGGELVGRREPGDPVRGRGDADPARRTHGSSSVDQLPARPAVPERRPARSRRRRARASATTTPARSSRSSGRPQRLVERRRRTARPRRRPARPAPTPRTSRASLAKPGRRPGPRPARRGSSAGAAGRGAGAGRSPAGRTRPGWRSARRARTRSAGRRSAARGRRRAGRSVAALLEQRLPQHPGAEAVGVEHELHRDALPGPAPAGLAPDVDGLLARGRRARPWSGSRGGRARGCWTRTSARSSGPAVVVPLPVLLQQGQRDVVGDRVRAAEQGRPGGRSAARSSSSTTGRSRRRTLARCEVASGFHGSRFALCAQFDQPPRHELGRFSTDRFLCAAPISLSVRSDQSGARSHRPDPVRRSRGASDGRHQPRSRTPRSRLRDDRRRRVSFGGITALTGVSLDVAPGQVLGVIGPNGAGQDHAVQRRLRLRRARRRHG